MKRSDNIIALQHRMSGINESNSYPYTLKFVERNPSDPPPSSMMPCLCILDLDEKVTGEKNRGASLPPIYEKRQYIAMEMWLKASNKAAASKELDVLLSCIRHRLFYDGITLGGKCLHVKEWEITRVLRPPTGDEPVVGYGMVISMDFIEDYGNITF